MIAFYGFLAFVGFLLLIGSGLKVVSQVFNNSTSGQTGGQSSVTITANGSVKGSALVPAAQPGVLTTHTTNTTGSLTMTNSNHGIITGQRIDIYWTGGQCYGAVAGTVAGSVVPIASVSGGSNLPASSTAVTIGICTSAAFEATGNNVTSLVCCPPINNPVALDSYFVFASVAPADILTEYVITGTFFQWYTGNGVTNPLAGLVPLKVWMSHDDTASAQTLECAATTT